MDPKVAELKMQIYDQVSFALDYLFQSGIYTPEKTSQMAKLCLFMFDSTLDYQQLIDSYNDLINQDFDLKNKLVSFTAHINQ